jgi:hypothetical protein
MASPPKAPPKKQATRDLTNSGTWTATPVGIGAPPGYWNAKQGVPASVQIAFSPHPVTITEVSAAVQQTPDGNTTHQVLATLEDGSEVPIAVWKGYTVSGEVLITDLSANPVGNVRALKINTIISPSWISWQAVQVSGF